MNSTIFSPASGFNKKKKGPMLQCTTSKGITKASLVSVLLNFTSIEKARDQV